LSACPVCRRDDCHYLELRDRQSWHPPLAELERLGDVAADALPPIWRCRPERPGVAVIALDPREALYVLANGCTLNDEPYAASLEGCDGRVQGDGRVAVRITPLHLHAATFVDSGAAVAA
jgi:hypothetical protein